MDKEFSSSISAALPVHLDTSIPTEISFDFSANPIPAGVTDLDLRIIFKGELEGPIALGIKNLNEPMFFKIANSTDRYYFNGTLKGPENFPPGAPELSLFNYQTSGSLGFYPPSGAPQEPTVDFSLPPGHFSKIAFLTEGELLGIRIDSSNHPPAEISYTSVVNEDSLSTAALLWREDYAHQNYSFFAVFPNMDGIWEAPWPALEFPAVPVAIWQP
jgi:hypothetical protein